jgi:hypothetical protein
MNAILTKKIIVAGLDSNQDTLRFNVIRTRSRSYFMASKYQIRIIISYLAGQQINVFSLQAFMTHIIQWNSIKTHDNHWVAPKLTHHHFSFKFQTITLSGNKET